MPTVSGAGAAQLSSTAAADGGSGRKRQLWRRASRKESSDAALVKRASAAAPQLVATLAVVSRALTDWCEPTAVGCSLSLSLSFKASLWCSHGCRDRSFARLSSHHHILQPISPLQVNPHGIIAVCAASEQPRDTNGTAALVTHHAFLCLTARVDERRVPLLLLQPSSFFKPALKHQT